MTKKYVAVLIFLFLLFPFYAQEEVLPEVSVESTPIIKQEEKSPEYRQVNGLENWTYDYDISGLEDGKYNLIIRSSDKAGNISIDGPINLFIDSESDLPIVSISSPSPFMRVGGDIYIVGTASDDDDVSYVEVRIDEGVFVKGEGSQFWSSFLDVSDIPDGRHTLTARATDINGLQGVESSVVINIDKTKPLITIDSHNNGEILSGNNNISGFVYDANGVSKLEYSLDGETYDELKLSGKADHTERKFSLKVDTRDNDGGTSYIRFKTVDGTGSDDSTVFVYYSDNEKPEINIISPIEEDILNGFITVTGTVSDEVGIASFSSRVGKDEEVLFEMISGNPYWSRTFDFRGEKSADVQFKAVDLSGNIEDYRLRLDLDSDGDIPQISLVNFQEDQIIDSDNFILQGIAADDDGIKKIEYAFDDNQSISVDTIGPFTINVVDLTPGKHKVRIKAVDLFDIESDQYDFSFQIANPEPQIQLGEYTSDKIVEPFNDGVIFQQGKTAKISGVVNGGEGISTITFNIGGEEGKSVKASKGNFVISLPNSLDIGGHDLHITATDSMDRQALFSSRIYFAPRPAKDETYLPVQEDVPGLYLIDARLETNDVINLDMESPLSGYIVGDTIRSVTLDPPQDSFTVTKNGNQFAVLPQTESRVQKFSIKITTDSGKEYISDPIEAGSDFTGPRINMDNLKVPVKLETTAVDASTELNGNGGETSSEEVNVTFEDAIVESDRIQDILIISGSFSDVSEIVRAEIIFSGSAGSYGRARTLETTLQENQYSFDQELDIVSIPEGEHFVIVELEDTIGNLTKNVIPFIIDRSAPQISIISPSAEVPVEGIITISGVLEGNSNGSQVTFTQNGIDYMLVDSMELHSFTHNIDLSVEDSDPELFLFKVIDQGRNQSSLKPVLNIDLESDQPKVAIEIPAVDSTILGDFAVTGLVFDDDAVETIFYSLDGSEFQETEGNFYYNIPFSLENISDGRHSISVKAQDTGGFMSDVVTTSFLISKEEPNSELLSPIIEDYTKNTITLDGQTFDENGVDRIYISYDNGITFNEATIIVEEIKTEVDEVSEVVNEDSEVVNEEPVIEEPVKTVKWTYTFDTKLPGDGTHSLLIKAVDGAGIVGISSTIINIDNTNPEIKMDSPSESDKVAGNLIIDGKVFDATGIKSVVSELKALDGEFEALIREIPTEGVFRDILDIRDFTPGWYNLNITVTDYAENSISETRNLLITPPIEGEYIELFFPEEGKEISGPFMIEGHVQSLSDMQRVVVKVDDSILDTIDVDDTGLFSFNVMENAISDGKHRISVVSSDSDHSISSSERNFSYTQEGPWVSVNNMKSGQFVSGRPLVTGLAGYSGFPEDKSKAVESVEVSLNNGRSFKKAKGRDEWEFRLETYDLPEGNNQLLVRAHFKDGSISVTKLFVNVDETAPQIELFTPEENKKFNETVALVGTAGDENGLDRVEVLIRKGSKESYEVPSFIQGLYVDVHALGSTYGELGVGLSFFDDVVKLQAQIGLSPPGRFSGMVIGAKLLANIVEIPFSYFFGYDWDFFSMSVAVGANFNYFTMSGDTYAFTGDGVVLGSVLLQYEFAKFELKNRKLFNSYSLYMEGSLWFISSDVEAGVTPTFSFGARIGVF